MFADATFIENKKNLIADITLGMRRRTWTSKKSKLKLVPNIIDIKIYTSVARRKLA